MSNCSLKIYDYTHRLVPRSTIVPAPSFYSAQQSTVLSLQWDIYINHSLLAHQDSRYIFRARRGHVWGEKCCVVSSSGHDMATVPVITWTRSVRSTVQHRWERGSEGSTMNGGAVDKRWLLGEESFFFEAVTAGRLPMLQWLPSKTCRQH